MTDRETEIFTLLYALGDAIKIKDWPSATTLWDRLLAMYSPLAEWHPDVATVLRNEAAMVQMAARQTIRIH